MSRDLLPFSHRNICEIAQWCRVSVQSVFNLRCWMGAEISAPCMPVKSSHSRLLWPCISCRPVCLYGLVLYCGIVLFKLGCTLTVIWNNTDIAIMIHHWHYTVDSWWWWWACSLMDPAGIYIMSYLYVFLAFPWPRTISLSTLCLFVAA